MTGAWGSALEVIERRSRRVAAPLTVTPPAPLSGHDRDGIDVELGRLGRVRVGLRGRHQAANVAVADAALDALEAAGIARVPDDARRAGYAAVHWPGRLELIEAAGREVLLDGAHNPAGAATLAEALDDLAPFLRPGRPALLLAVMADKDVDGIVRALAGSTLLREARVICTAPAGGRALPADRLAARWHALAGRAAEAVAEPGAALDAALSPGVASRLVRAQSWWPVPSTWLERSGPYSSRIQGSSPIRHCRIARSCRSRRRSHQFTARPCPRTLRRLASVRACSSGAVKTYVMGIVNVTPDSFSGDGLLAGVAGRGGAVVEAAVVQAREMVEDGADILDVGGESTRPGHEPVGEDEEVARVLPVVAAIHAALPDVPLSIDTTKPGVAAAALDAGAALVNDVWGVSTDDAMVRLAAARGVPLVVMHNRSQPIYGDFMAELMEDLRAALGRAESAGVPPSALIVDPGFGFGKTPEHNLTVLRELATLRQLGRPVLLGTSRKSTIGRVLGGLPTEERLEGTLATTALAVAAGVDMIRVHDVRANVRAALVADAVCRGERP